MPTLQFKEAMKEIFRILTIFANYTFLGPIKMTIEALQGKTFSGEFLTIFGRINHIIIQGFNVAAYLLFFTGSLKIAGWCYAFSWLIDSIQYYPEIFGSIGKLCGSIGMMRISRAFSTTKTWLDRKGVRKLFFK